MTGFLDQATRSSADEFAIEDSVQGGTDTFTIVVSYVRPVPQTGPVLVSDAIPPGLTTTSATGPRLGLLDGSASCARTNPPRAWIQIIVRYICERSSDRNRHGGRRMSCRLPHRDSDLHIRDRPPLTTVSLLTVRRSAPAPAAPPDHGDSHGDRARRWASSTLSFPIFSAGHRASSITWRRTDAPTRPMNPARSCADDRAAASEKGMSTPTAR